MAVIAIATICLMSCRKNESIDLNPNLNTANDLIIAQRPVAFAFRMLVRAIHDEELQQSYHSSFDGASVLLNPQTNTYCFYFLNETGPDSVLRYGRVDMTLSGDFYTTGTTISITFVDYAEDGMSVTGDDSLVNAGMTNDSLLFVNTVKEGIVHKDTMGVIRFSSRLEYRVPVSAPGYPLQSLIMLTGTTEGISSKGHSFSADVKTPVAFPVYTSRCAWPRQGKIMVVVPDGEIMNSDIRFPALTSCNDSVYYDFGSTTYQWRMKASYLKH